MDYFRAKPKLPELGPDEQMIAYFVNRESAQAMQAMIYFIPLSLLLAAFAAAALVAGLSHPGSLNVAVASVGTTSYGHVGTLRMLPMLVLYAILCTVVPFVMLVEMFKLPNYVQISGRGFRLHWLSLRCWSSPWIPWQAVGSITVSDRAAPSYIQSSLVSQQMGGGPLRLRLQEVTRPRTALTLTYSIGQFAPSWFTGMAGVVGRFLKAPDKTCPLTVFVDVLLPEDKSALISACLKYAPDHLSPELLALETTETVPQYTTLWLDQFERERSTSDLKPLSPGTTLSGPKRKYKIDMRVGSGGQALTYKAQVESSDGQSEGQQSQSQSGASVILKEFFLPTGGGLEITEQAIDHIRKEYELIKALDHPQIVRCSDFFVSGRRAYLVMNLIEGRTLRSLVESQGSLDEDEVLRLAQQMCGILSYLHGREPSVVHRDFTPDNLILTNEGNLVLIDFNVAKRLESDSSTMTAVGRHCYIPIEQFQRRATTKSDIYGMGCTLFFLLTGKEPEPITASNVQAHMPGASDFIQALIARATAKSQANRYTDANEIASELEDYRHVELPSQVVSHAVIE